nr:transcriptional repressor [Comamonas jiangduensis]
MRATRAVQVLLSVLPAQQPAQGGRKRRSALQAQGVQVNRVTVYRALDRLAEAGLLQRSVDAQRTTRYWVANTLAPAPSAHMECKACHQPMELDDSAAAVQAALQALRQAVAQTAGVHNPTLDVTVQAECAHCAHGQ